MRKEDFSIIVYRCIRDSICENVEWVDLKDNKITVLTKFGDKLEEKYSWTIDLSMLGETGALGSVVANDPDKSSSPSFLSRLFRRREGK